MKIGRLITAAIVLAALAATLYWSNHHAPVEQAAKIAALAPPKILSLNQEDVTKLEIKKKGGDNVVLTRVGPDNWKIISPRPFFADQISVSSMLVDLSLLDADRIIEENASDLKSYGLADPAVEVSVTDKDGKSYKFLIGDDTPAGGGAYIKLANDPRVFTVASTVKPHFNKDLSGLRDRHLLPMDFDKVSSVDISGPKLHFTFGDENGKWVARNPKNLRADSSILQTMVEKLKSADMEPDTPDADMKKAASAFSSGNPVADVKVTDPSGSQELQIRKNNTDYYAKTTAMDGVYKLSSDVGDAFESNIEEFLEKQVFDFADETPEKIEMHNGAKTVLLNWSGPDWLSNGKKMDPVAVEGFIRSIRVLAATKFATSGFSSPTLSLTVVSDSGKRTEKVQIAKSGKDYIAKRDDTPTLYEMDAGLVDEVRQSAAKVVPYETPSAQK